MNEYNKRKTDSQRTKTSGYQTSRERAWGGTKIGENRG